MAKKTMRDFIGILSKESEDRLERAIHKRRVLSLKAHERRMDRLVRQLQIVFSTELL